MSDEVNAAGERFLARVRTHGMDLALSIYDAETAVLIMRHRDQAERQRIAQMIIAIWTAFAEAPDA